MPSRERTGALEISNLDWARGFFGDAPPARMALYTPSSGSGGVQDNHGLKPFASLLKLNEQLTGKLQLDILAAVKKVAKKVGIEMVLDKQVVITGGMDLSDMVVNELNK